ncbi:hypothetical protein EJB05_35805, partial [Eragrostis curvula]
MELAPQKAEGTPLNLLRTGASSPPLHLFPSGSSSRAPTLAAAELLHRQRPPLLPSPRPFAADLRRRVRSGGCSGCTVVAGPTSTDDPLLLPSRAAAQPPPTWNQGRRRSRRSLLQDPLPLPASSSLGVGCEMAGDTTAQCKQRSHGRRGYNEEHISIKLYLYKQSKYTLCFQAPAVKVQECDNLWRTDSKGYQVISVCPVGGGGMKIRHSEVQLAVPSTYRKLTNRLCCTVPLPP